MRFKISCLLIAVLFCEVGLAQPASQNILLPLIQEVRSFYKNNWQLELDLAPENVQSDPLLEYDGFFDTENLQVLLKSNLPETSIKLNLIHEGIHFIRHKYNTNEDRWLEEGMAKVAEYAYSGVWPARYEGLLFLNNQFCLNTEKSSFAPNGSGYASSFYFVYYLYSRFGGMPFFKLMLHSNLSGWSNILNAIENGRMQGVHNIPAQFTTRESIIRHFAVALAINDPFLANYGLFYLNNNHLLNLQKINTYQICPSGTDFKIAYSLNDLPTNFSEAWLLYKEPFSLVPIFNALPNKITALKISINY